MLDHSFLSNESQTTFLKKLKENLSSCESFAFSVSFIKKAGLSLLEDSIEAALLRGVKGQIITSTYQNFTDIPSLEVFLSWQSRYPSFETHLDYGCFGDNGFHTKGYFFSFKGSQEVIVGSSNITYFALIKNKEWDLSLKVSDIDEAYSSAKGEFDCFWLRTHPLSREIIRQYSEHLAYSIEKWDMDFFDPEKGASIRPNMMQREALKEISRYRDMNIGKALVVAATGSGKTYLAAFDAFNANAKRLLFIVHRDVILENALKTFSHVFGTSRSYGIYTGKEKSGLSSDFIFASTRILSEHLSLFARDEFDYIVIDEVHHAAASTYQRIMKHFQPHFLLGLTATPERMDEKSIYDLFDRNVPYDLRLREAMESDLIVPFHYYGIRDSLITYKEKPSQEDIRRMIAEISSSTHCEFVREQIERYRPKEDKLRCVAFCRSVEHARMMAANMSLLGYVTCSLSGSDSFGVRMKAFDDLQDETNPLTIIFAVDILNEGIDIPSLNMVLFLRPTESSTIFIQQLGRGLRKYPRKEFLTVLDFIANSYLRSSQIALALGSLSKSGTSDKRTILDHIRTNFAELSIPGLSISFDEESREEILAAVEATDFNRFELLKQDYCNFKEYLKLKPGEYPMPTDFLVGELSIDLLRYTRKFPSYHDFLKQCGEDVPFFNDEQLSVIRTLFWYLPLVRKDEFLILSSLLEGKRTTENLLLNEKNEPFFNETSFQHALHMLSGGIASPVKEFFTPLINITNDTCSLKFDLSNPTFATWVRDILEYGILSYEQKNGNNNKLLKLYGLYTSAKSLMALNNSNLYLMSGVHYANAALCLYVNLNKDAKVEERLDYKDRFLSRRILQWESQTGTTLLNVKGKRLINEGIAEIFIKKTKKENGITLPFIYIGRGHLTNPRQSNNAAKTLLFDIILEDEIPEEYKYDFGIEDTQTA